MKVSDIQRFCMHDGPGLRTTVFLKGCPLSCRWCHNPESRSSSPMLRFTEARCFSCGTCINICPNDVHSFSDGKHIIDRSKCTACTGCVAACPALALSVDSKDMSCEEILKEVLKDKAFYGELGGVTLSGGEPLMHIREAITLLKVFKENGLNTAIETCGYWNSEFIGELVPLVDTFLFDVKDTDDCRHKAFTGVSASLIMDNLRLLDEAGAKIILRFIIVNGVNANEEHVINLANLTHSLKNVIRSDFMPCRDIANSKYDQYGIIDKIKSEWSPDPTRFENLKQLYNETLKSL